jgi:hypothetical protein
MMTEASAVEIERGVAPLDAGALTAIAADHRSRAGRSVNPWLVLVIACLAQFMVTRRAWGLFAVQRPAAMCVATGIDDVEAALAYARAHRLRVATHTTGSLAWVLPDLRDTLLLRLALPDLDDPSSGAAHTGDTAAGRT